jgi:hypothetical protein
MRFAQLKRRKATILAATMVLAGLSYQVARAQTDPRSILSQVILQLQTGTPNPQWYGPQLWQTIAAQTGNTGIYAALVQL